MLVPGLSAWTAFVLRTHAPRGVLQLCAGSASSTRTSTQSTSIHLARISVIDCTMLARRAHCTVRHIALPSPVVPTARPGSVHGQVTRAHSPRANCEQRSQNRTRPHLGTRATRRAHGARPIRSPAVCFPIVEPVFAHRSDAICILRLPWASPNPRKILIDIADEPTPRREPARERHRRHPDGRTLSFARPPILLCPPPPNRHRAVRELNTTTFNLCVVFGAPSVAHKDGDDGCFAVRPLDECCLSISVDVYDGTLMSEDRITVQLRMRKVQTSYVTGRCESVQEARNDVHSEYMCCGGPNAAAEMRNVWVRAIWRSES